MWALRALRESLISNGMLQQTQYLPLAVEVRRDPLASDLISVKSREGRSEEPGEAQFRRLFMQSRSQAAL